MTTATQRQTPHEFHAAIRDIDLATVPVMTTDRRLPRKEQAKLTRQLFRRLGLRGISVTCPNYSMAHSVEVRLLKREDYTRDASGEIEWMTDPAAVANGAARRRVMDILGRAFPEHGDRSDMMTDYFDFCWSVD